MSTNSPSLLKKSHKDQVRKVAFTLQFLYGPVFFFSSGFGAIDVPFSSLVNGLFVSNPFSLVSAVWTIGHNNHASDCEIPCF